MTTTDSLTLSGAAAHTFHTLPVRAIEPLTDDAVAVTFSVPPELRTQYAYEPGQHLTVRRFVDGAEMRRNYSICVPPPADGLPESLTIAVKRLGPGGFGEYAAETLRVGEELEVMTPMGRFRLQDGEHHVAIAAGSGITPVLAIAGAALRRGERVSLIYGNRATASIMFLEEIADLKNTYPDRFTALHVLSRESRESALLSGRIDASNLPVLLSAVGEADQYYLCGPMGLVTTSRDVLTAAGVPRKHVHFELFHADTPPPRPAEVAVPVAGTEITVRLGGRLSQATMTADDACVLDTVLRVRPDAPYSCTGGVCGTCRARLTEGEVTMTVDYALEPDEKAEGFVLACQSRPQSERVALDFDA